jgi:hypothetical protein
LSQAGCANSDCTRFYDKLYWGKLYWGKPYWGLSDC